MAIAFLVLYILSSHLVHAVAVDQQNGFNPYPFGTTIFCMLYHPLLLVSGIYYLGWLFGILLFLAHLFGIIHATVSWIFDIPSLYFINDKDRLLKYQKAKINLLFPLIVVNLVFTVVSFFVADFKSLFYFLNDNTCYLYAIIIITIVLSIFLSYNLYLPHAGFLTKYTRCGAFRAPQL